MISITGSHNTAICYTHQLEPTAKEQIKNVCDRPEFADCKIRIMPDVHAGMGCTIGTTMTIKNKIVPGMVGVDIGCGMETVKLAEREIDYKGLDKMVKQRIPAGRNVRKDIHPFNDKIKFEELRCIKHVDIKRARQSIGTLGGGNHFIEVDRTDSGDLYLVIHSGSRHIGTEVAEYYQKEAHKQCGDSIPKDLTYATGKLFDDYIHDMKIIQRFAALNRKAMAEIILEGMGLTEIERFTTIHNYIDTDSMILRKGAVSARVGERLLIPINMRDGSLICVGKGNLDWNYSAPHGAGRLMSRRVALKELSLEKYVAEMKGVYTSSVHRGTLDESPMAYKKIDEIISHIGPTAEIVERMKPTYNFKAGD
ncbi:MAG: RtcB family protein [Chitinispirillales bacterium]|jgi:RNA-splicing ligase RtcB|nr:RtcB family protein [Chitinispirillales bacterium]